MLIMISFKWRKLHKTFTCKCSSIIRIILYAITFLFALYMMYFNISCAPREVVFAYTMSINQYKDTPPMLAYKCFLRSDDPDAILNFEDEAKIKMTCFDTVTVPPTYCSELLKPNELSAAIHAAENSGMPFTYETYSETFDDAITRRKTSEKLREKNSGGNKDDN